MKSLFAATVLAILLVHSVTRANLADTYAISCQRFGSPYSVDRKNRFIYWPMYGGNRQIGLIAEQFLHNECVCIIYLETYAGGVGYRDQDIWQALAQNARSNQTWIENREQSGRGWVTNDGRIYGKMFVYNGTLILRVAYTSWLKRHGLLYVPPAPSLRPPVEEEEPRKPRKLKPRPKATPELPPVEDSV